MHDDPERNRTVGTMLGAELTRRFGSEGSPDGTIDVTFRGSAGQSFGAFVPPGITLRLEGDANDYLGKGLSGGTLVVRPPRTAPFVAEENIIAGNVILYGATDGNVFTVQHGPHGGRAPGPVRGPDAAVTAAGRAPATASSRSSRDRRSVPPR